MCISRVVDNFFGAAKKPAKTKRKISENFYRKTVYKHKIILYNNTAIESLRE